MKEPADNSAGTFIAITGMAGRFPGARNISEFWRNLRDGVESISFLSQEQLLAAGVARSDLANPDYVPAAAILDEIDLFDASFFGFSPRDAAIMDPQHRLFLECAWEALENAGWCSDQFNGRIGVYAGSGMNSYLIHNLLNNPEVVASSGLFVLKQTGNDKDVLATRVSYQLNLTGPSLSVQTACSTSLVAVHLACQSLLNQECDMALAGGVTIEVPHGVGYIYREGEILSRDGHCRAFDADSSGTIFGSGVGIVVLRRLEDALRDGDCVHAVIRGTAINNDGARKVGYLAPSVVGQSEAIVEALGVAGVEADSISYIECHGTGTTVGDPIEINALTNAFRISTDQKGFCAVGSVKTNVGHLDAAAGVAGLIKTVLALKHRQLPPTLNLSKPNPLIDFEASPFYLNSKLREWQPEGCPRRAGVTSLGIGGTNAHVVVEEAPVSPPSDDSRPFQMLTLSAKTESALDATVRNIAGYLADNPGKLADVAYTCHLGRKEFSYRRAIVSTDIDDAIATIRRRDLKRTVSNTAADREPPVMFLFSGQGSQYVDMGVDIYRSESEFRSVVDFCADFLKPVIGLDLRAILFAGDGEAEQAARLLNETRLTQPALFVIEYALAKLWLNWGIQPKAMIGHSIGEFAAACVSGVFSLETGLRLVAERGRLMQSMPQGAMTAVLLPEKEVSAFLGNGISLAAVNSEDQCVVSGAESSVGRLEAALTAKSVTYHRLRVSHAFHSSMMDPILQSYEEFVRGVELKPPQIPYVSCVTGTWVSDSEATAPSYWSRQLREPVRFSRGVSELLREPDGLFLEIGPGNTLSALTEQHENLSETQEVVSSMRVRFEAVSDAETLTLALAKLWAAGKRINWRTFHTHEQRQRLPLPTYPFERQRFWIDPVSRDRGTEQTGDDLQQGKDDSIRLFRQTWIRASLGADPASRAIGPWLIFKDSGGLGSHIAASLRGSGERCVVVTPGVSFRRISDDEFQIGAANPADYAALVSALTDERRLPRSIIHLWSVTPSNSLEQQLDDLQETEILSFYSLLYFSQALGAADVETPIQIGIVTSGLFRVADETVLHFERALVLGPCGVIPKEFPNITCRSIDVEVADRSVSTNGHVADGLREATNQILSELRSGVNDSPVAYRNGRRWTQTFLQIEAAASDRAIALRAGGVYLITGGLGGIGLVLAESIARRCPSRFVLTGRSVFPPRGEWDEWLDTHDASDLIVRKIRAIRSIEALDSEVLVVNADVTDLEDMRRALAQAKANFGSVTGVIHAAGVIDDTPILQKSASSAARVLAPKVRGTMVLKSLLASEPLDFLILSSSVSSMVAPAGQIDYVAANAVLDAFADSTGMVEKYRTIAIQWPRWRDVGLAADRVKSQDEKPSYFLPPKTANLDQPDIEHFTKLNLERDWIVNEHRLKSGVGLFPGTGYIELVRALIIARLGQKTVRIQDLTINAPLKVEPSLEQPLGVLLRREKEGYRLSIRTIVHNDGGGWIECAQGRVDVAPRARPAVVNIRRIRKRCNRRELKFDSANQNRTQERHIDFGPRWRNLKRIWVGRGEALSEVELAEKFATDLVDHSVHPAILDMATGAAMFLIDGYGEIEFLYVPVSYGKITLRGELPTRCYGHIRAKKGVNRDSRTAEFDITILDERGSVLLDIEDLSFLQIRDPAILDRNGVRTAPAMSSSTNWSSTSIHRDAHGIGRDSISSTQGADAFSAVLANALASRIVVFPSNLRAFLEENRRDGVRRKGRSSVSTAEALPQDEIEATLAGWWEELLGVQGIATKESFFQLGGDSLTAARFFAKVNRKYGIKLSLATMFAAPTVEKLARIVRDEEKPPSYSSIVPIQPLGAKAPLYVVHGRGGEVLLYSDLAKHLPNDQPVYGIQSPTLGDSKRGLLRLEDLAAHYIEEIRSIQPEGPYFLLGHSLGGVVGFEIAQQLRVAGHEVGLLGMLDTWEIGYISRLQRGQSFLSASIKRSEHWLDHARRVLRGPRRLAYINQKLAGRFRWLKIDSKQRALGLLYTIFRKTTLPLPRILDRPEDINDFVYGRYQPRPYPGRVVVFRAENGVAANDSRYSYALGWEDLAEAGTEVYEVPGTHTGLLQEPNVRILAEKVTACMEIHRHED